MTVSVDWLALGPALAPAGAALLVLVLDALAPRLAMGSTILSVVGLVGGLALAVPGALAPAEAPVRTLCRPAPEGACLWTAGPVSSTLQIGALGAGLVVVLLLLGREGLGGGRQLAGPAVTDSLVLAAVTGAVSVAAAHDLATWLISLELATVPVVALIALRGTRQSAHGALALLLTSLTSFALLVTGAALWLTATGDPTFRPDTLGAALGDPLRRPLVLVAAVLLVTGVGFKLSLVPFHAWTPQVYATASLPLAAFVATVSKIAATAAIIGLLKPFTLLASSAELRVLRIVLAVLAATSMILGAAVLLRAESATRFLAWSTIGQGGWVLLPLVALTAEGLRSAAFYVLVYAAATLLAFTVLASVATPSRATRPGELRPDRELAAYRGILRAHPLVGGALALALLVLAGLPPGVAGLVAKVVALRPLPGVGWWPLAVVAVVAVVLGIAAYLRWFAMLIAPRGGAPVVTGPGERAALTLGTIVLVALCVLPQFLLGPLS